MASSLATEISSMRRAVEQGRFDAERSDVDAIAWLQTEPREWACVGPGRGFLTIKLLEFKPCSL